MCAGTWRIAALGLLLALFLGAAAPPAGAAVALNEINCEGTDWVELVNPSDEAADLSGWLLTDDPIDGTRADHRLDFAEGTEISAQGNLVVERGDAGFPFGISCGGDTLRLADAADLLADEISLANLTNPADTWGRYPNATGSWVQTAPTKGAANLPSSSGPPGGHADRLFEPSKVVGVDLSIPQASRDALAEEPSEYQPATFSLTTDGGTYGPLEVGVRLKGAATFRPLTGKASFKVKFSHSLPGQRFLGLKTLTLNSMISDPTMVRETLAYEAFRAAGVPASRTGYAYVKVDGQDYGLYLSLETLDEVSLARWFDTTQHLYEGDHSHDVVPGGAGDFEVDEGDKSDRSDLEGLISAANGSGDLFQRLAPVADADEFVRMWAVERYIGHFDSYTGFESPFQPANYFLHSDAAGRFAMLPWGTDQTWAHAFAFDADGGGVLFDRCLAEADCAGRYRRAVQGLPSLFAPLNLDSRAAELAAAIAPWQERDPRREASSERAATDLRWTRDFIARRPADIAAWLDPPDPPPKPSAPPSGPKFAPPAAAPATPLARLAIGASLRARNSLRRVLRGGLRVRASCSMRCAAAGRLLLPRRSARGLGLGSGAAPVVLGRGAGPGGRVVTLRLGKRSRRALRGRRSVGVVVELSALDPLGRRAQAQRKVTLVR